MIIAIIAIIILSEKLTLRTTLKTRLASFPKQGGGNTITPDHESVEVIIVIAIIWKEVKIKIVS